MAENERSIEAILAESGLYVGLTKGISMRPMLREGRDTIILSPCEGRLKKYDIPLYRRGEAYVLHRVVKVREHDYVICGDNCMNKEYGITDADIVGVLTGVRRGDRYLSLSSPSYRIYCRVHVALYPVRILFKKAWALPRRIFRRFVRKKECK